LPLPFTPLSDAAGEVVAVGQEVTTLKSGDRVVSHFFFDWQDGEAPRKKRAARWLSAAGIAGRILAVAGARASAPAFVSQLRRRFDGSYRRSDGVERTISVGPSRAAPGNSVLLEGRVASRPSRCTRARRGSAPSSLRAATLNSRALARSVPMTLSTIALRPHGG